MYSKFVITRLNRAYVGKFCAEKIPGLHNFLCPVHLCGATAHYFRSLSLSVSLLFRSYDMA